MRTLFNQEVIKRGVLFQGVFCPCFSHTDEDVAHILWAFDEAMEMYKKGLEDGYEKYLVGDVIKPVFRKLI
jgi:spore coat polysaccharide biosynthesis protein SpsF